MTHFKDAKQQQKSGHVSDYTLLAAMAEQADELSKYIEAEPAIIPDSEIRQRVATTIRKIGSFLQTHSLSHLVEGDDE